ncbi:S-layer homology domain-containing protein [Mangrovibacillus cuniculi]|uniref:S-layer protein n=1 Tax=Mangrovibacillus cuniculi TaxID=2593652 RepID=A0A7S8CCW5_9BACI|nr:S-layer homology domain-containing protein [Mangrovibacillus cuniculi]QPC47531.1 S-layer protein [Mangrovibacillus cuniculi]
MKRLFSLILSLLLLSSVFSTNVSANSADIEGHYFETQLRELIVKDIMTGYEDGTYRPNNNVTRAEFASFIIRVLDLYSVKSAEFPGVSIAEVKESRYNDVTSDKWYYSSVEKASSLGIVNGYDGGVFKPNNVITREEMAAMVINTLNTRGVLSRPSETIFTDDHLIGKWALDSVKRLVYLGVMSGKSGNKFVPKAPTTRGETAAVLSRSISLLSPLKGLEYKVAVLDEDGNPYVLREFTNFNDAQRSAVDNQVIMQNNRIVYMKSGFAIPNGIGLAVIYPTENLSGTSITYIEAGIEMKYLAATENVVKVSIGTTVGYVDIRYVNLLPFELIKNRSYYENRNGNLVHLIFNHLTQKYGSTSTIGKAPAFLKENEKYYSWDTVNYYSTTGILVGREYQYFQHLPLHTKSAYTAEELDTYLRVAYPEAFKARYEISPLVGIGKYLKDVENKYEINALYLMAHAIHESEWGTSQIATEKKNLFGSNARDGSAYEDAFSFPSFKESIEYTANSVSARYHDAKGIYYHGSVLGNKQIGMNMKYASDPFWGEKISAHMYRADVLLGKKDIGKYKLLLSNESGLRVRNNYGTTNTDTLYQMQLIGTPMIYKAQATKDGALWYNVVSDLKTNRDGYVYGNGSFGQYVLEIPVAK